MYLQMIGHSCHLPLFSLMQFLNMSSLQAALPNPTLPVAFFGGITETCFPQGSATSYMDAVPPGEY